jgi:PhoPQ-activated pathogenicity-related protein
LKSFGKFSDQIADYTKAKLVPFPDVPEAKKLWEMVDPYSYRDKLTLPKFIVNGANDPYWTTDALNLYWDGLKGDKWVVYVPNAGHNLEQTLPDGKKDRNRAIGGLITFAKSQIFDKELPKLSWKHSGSEQKFSLKVDSSVKPSGSRLWVVDAETRDFRKATWVEQPARLDGTSIFGEVEAPVKGFRCFFAEIDFEMDGVKYQLSTQNRIVEAKN